MSAKQLIELANTKKLGVSRFKPGIYEYHQIIEGKHVTTKFFGSWSEFVKFIKAF